MKKNRLVIALGGNALGNTPSEQKEKAAACAKVLAELASRGYELILAHGNGPQVGMIHLGLSHAAADGVIKAAMPLAECTALSQGYIGYHLQNALRNELDKRNIRKEAVTLLTQVVVDAGDKAFSDPTKPVGAFYSREEAEKLSAQEGFVMKEDAGRGWRRVVPSPKPADIVEKEAVMKLAREGCIVIAVGGGGIPVIRTENGFEGVAAVIDKDYASEKLAELTEAGQLIILTAVDSVAVHYQKPNEKHLRRMTVKEAKAYAEAGEFAPGSMLPKIEAACLFASLGEDRRAVIGHLDQALACAEGRAGTEIVL